MQNVEHDPNYQLGGALMRLKLIKQLTDLLMDGPGPDRDDPFEWALLWDRIAQIQNLSNCDA